MGGKRGFSSEDTVILGHIMESIDESVRWMRESHEKKDHENFNRAKKLVINLQKKMLEVLQ
jgi:hypothetical protein